MKADLAAIFNALIAERGGPEAFDVTALAVARAVAAQLASDRPDGAELLRLTQLLPAKQKPAAEPDISKLSLRELATLERLCAKAEGRAAPPPEPKVSKRQADADRLVAVLDAAEKRGGLIESDRVRIATLISCLLRPLAWPRDLWPETPPPPPPPAPLALPAPDPRRIVLVGTAERNWP